MNYYDTNTRGLSNGSTPTSIPSSDPRVSSWFEPLPEGYRRAYTNDGFPFNEIIPGPTPEEQMKIDATEVNNAIQEHLDSAARLLRYDDMTSARAYAGYVNDFQGEGTLLGQWASDCWTYSGIVEKAVLAGARAMPTPEEAIAELPKFGAQ